MKKFYKVFLFFILSVSFFNITVSAKTLRQKKKDTDKKIQNIKKEINENTKKTNNVYNEIIGLDNKIQKLDLNISKLNGDIKNTGKNIEIKEGELNKAKEDLRNNDEKFKQRLKNMYMKGDSEFIEIMLSSKDINDFFNKTEFFKSMATRDQKLLDFIQSKVDVINKKKEELNLVKNKLQNTKNDLNNKKAESSSLKKEKNIVYANLKKDKALAEQELDKLQKESYALGKLIEKAQSSSAKYVGGKLGWPVPGIYRISSRYGYRKHPIFGIMRLHSGIDIPGSTGTKIVAAQSGKVIHAGWYGGYGNIVLIDHGGKIVTGYGHCSSILVRKGQSVKKGQAIALIGSTGFSTGPHLHFEVRQNGSFTNPEPWLRK